MGGKITYYPGNSGLDWMLMKLVDVSAVTTISTDAFKTTSIVIALLLSFAYVLFSEMTGQIKERTDRTDPGGDEEEDDALQENQYLEDANKMKDLIEGAANKLWAAERHEDDDELLTTEKAKDFLAERANAFITGENDRNQSLISCVLQHTDQENARWLTQLIVAGYLFL